MTWTPPRFTHLITFVTEHAPQVGLVGMLFQAVIHSDIDLTEEFLKAKNSTDMSAISRNYIDKHEKEIKKFLPTHDKDQRPIRIIYYQQIRR